MIRAWQIWFGLGGIAAFFFAFGIYWWTLPEQMDELEPGRVAIGFGDIAGWQDDDHAGAFAAFRRSCVHIVKRADIRARKKSGKKSRYAVLEPVCRKALAMGETVSDAEARAFFEDNFTPVRFSELGPAGLVTGYYEPELPGSRTRSDRFNVPVYRVPSDLVQFYSDRERAKRNHQMTAGRKTEDGVVPYYDRREIEEGALEGRGLELVYLEDPAEAFYMHIQGSARIALAEGGHMRIGFAAKNGHSYTSIGNLMIKRGTLPKSKMSMKGIRAWMAANPDEAKKLRWENRSYIFFRELPRSLSGAGPVGAQGVSLTPRRSLAVDTSVHLLGTPIWVDAPKLKSHGKDGFSHLMIAQDAGSAIKGRERGDIFWGSGDAAGKVAGRVKHKATFTVLLPKQDLPES
ncbi:MAG: MltA domain-containing protein [Hyphomicrobiaceae bacterium]|nr:MltA domain-containing protein [Hyphomicrobiaceae bacterium]